MFTVHVRLRGYDELNKNELRIWYGARNRVTKRRNRLLEDWGFTQLPTRGQKAPSGHVPHRSLRDAAETERAAPFTELNSPLLNPAGRNPPHAIPSRKRHDKNLRASVGRERHEVSVLYANCER